MVVFIVVAVVLVLMTGFLFVALRGITRRLSEEARRNAIRQVDIYDNLIAQKEHEIQVVNARLARQRGQLEAQSSLAQHEQPATVQQRPAFFNVFQGDYIDESFSEAYRELRNAFGFDKTKCIKAVLSEYGSQIKEGNAHYLGILDSFPFEQRFLLCTLSDEDQQRVLDEALSEQQKPLLDGFVEENGGYDGIAFFDWLVAQADAFSDAIVVRTGCDEDDFSSLDSRIKTVYDERICEGIQITIGSTLYDFSIQDMELCK